MNLEVWQGTWNRGSECGSMVVNMEAWQGRVEVWRETWKRGSEHGGVAENMEVCQ